MDKNDTFKALRYPVHRDCHNCKHWDEDNVGCQRAQFAYCINAYIDMSSVVPTGEKVHYKNLWEWDEK